jgi:glutamate--cysteine ligase
MRSEVWRDTDNQRTGMLPFVFEPGMGYERYVDYALDVPMYFIYRDGKYIDATGQSFRDFMAGKLKGFEGERPTADDWADHLTTLFPEVRLKRFLEMRGADGGRWNTITALSAFWTGILYDEVALDQAWQMVRDWNAEEREALRDRVPKTGLGTAFRSTNVGELARQALSISQKGLKNRGHINALGQDETVYLQPLEAISDSGQTVSDELLRRYASDWNGNIDHIFEEFAF